MKQNSNVNNKGWCDSHWQTTEDLDGSTSSNKTKQNRFVANFINYTLGTPIMH